MPIYRIIWSLLVKCVHIGSYTVVQKKTRVLQGQPCYQQWQCPLCTLTNMFMGFTE